MWTSRHLNKKFTIFFLIVAIVFLIYLLIFTKEVKKSVLEFDFESIKLKLNNKSRCYMPPLRESIEYFSDILNDEYQPEPDEDIFFLETSCSTTGITALNVK